MHSSRDALRRERWVKTTWNSPGELDGHSPSRFRSTGSQPDDVPSWARECMDRIVRAQARRKGCMCAAVHRSAIMFGHRLVEAVGGRPGRRRRQPLRGLVRPRHSVSDRRPMPDCTVTRLSRSALDGHGRLGSAARPSADPEIAYLAGHTPARLFAAHRERLRSRCQAVWATSTPRGSPTQSSDSFTNSVTISSAAASIYP